MSGFYITLEYKYKLSFKISLFSLTVLLTILLVQFEVEDNICYKCKFKILLFRIKGACYEVIVQNEDKVELSIKRMWDHYLEGKFVPLNIDKWLLVKIWIGILFTF